MIALPRVLHDDTVTIVKITSGLPDADGIPARTEARTPWAGVNVQQLTTTELVDQGRNTTVTTWRVAGPPAAVAEGDRIDWAGQTYQVDGTPDTRTGAHRINRTVLQMIRATG